MQDDYKWRMREYARRTADELLKQLHSRPAEESPESEGIATWKDRSVTA